MRLITACQMTPDIDKYIHSPPPWSSTSYYSEFLFLQFYLSGHILIIECHSKLPIHFESYSAILFRSLYSQQHVQVVSQWDAFGELQTLNTFYPDVCCHCGAAAGLC